MLSAWTLHGPADAAYLDATARGLPDATETSYGFAVADVDGDGNPDVLVAGNVRSLLLRNAGDGTFTDDTAARLPEATGAAAMAAAFVDVDGNGAPDIVLATTGRNRILINDGTGLFDDQSAERLPGLVETSVDVAAGDVDGDGDMDLVVANRGSTNRLLLNDGTGRFTAAAAGRLPGSNGGTAVVLADLNGDGPPDLYFAAADGTGLLLANDGLGAFTDVSATALPAVASEHTDAVAVDIEGDGDPDLVLGAGAAGVRLLVNQDHAPGTFVDESGSRLPDLAAYVIAVATGDVDEDGDTDLVLASAGPDQALLNDGTGSFIVPPIPVLPADPEGRRSFGIVALDADGDLDADLLLATPQDRDRLLVNDIPFPRIRLAVSPDYIEVGTPVTITIKLFDEDGASLRSLTANGTDITGSVSGGLAVYTPSTAGTVAVVATATDPGGNVGTRSIQFLAQPPDVTPPTVDLQVDAPSPLLAGHELAFLVTAADDRAVVSRTLTVNGEDLPLDTGGRAGYTATVAGELAVVATATDAAGNAGSDAATLTVGADEVPPTVGVSAAPDPAELLSPVAITVTAADNVAVVALSAAVEGPGLSAPEAVALDGDGRGTFRPLSPGRFTVTGTATDPSGNSGTATGAFEAEGAPDTVAPRLTASLDRSPALYDAGEEVLVSISASDDTGTPAIGLSVDGVTRGVTLPVTRIATGTFEAGSAHTVVVTAADISGNSTSATLFFAITDPADATPPTVALAAPAPDAEVALSEVVVGTVRDANLYRYDVRLSRLSDPGFFEAFSGNANVEDGVLGTLDASKLENGMYEMRLTAVDSNGLASSVAQTVRVNGLAKTGRLRLTFTDLELPLAGVPIRVSRTYDSTVRSRRDFGVGWTLELRRGSIESNRIHGDGWQILDGGFLGIRKCDSVRETLPHVIEARLSDREFYYFRPRLEVTGASTGSCQGRVHYEQVGGSRSGASLAVIGDNRFLYQTGFNQVTDIGGALFNPDRLRLTTLDRREFDFSTTDGLVRLQDRNGNALQISPSGISHSSGRSIAFIRDGEGRIEQVVDPDGETIGYSYDDAGDLVGVTDREGERQLFFYEDHLLLEVRNGAGEPTLSNRFDAEGRLVATTGADGLTTRFEHDLDARREIIVDEAGNRSLVEYNDQGGIIAQTDATGVTTRYEYDAEGNRIRVIFHDTVVATYEYTNGYVTAAVDNRGNRWEYERNARGQIVLLRNPLLQETRYQYDANGNLEKVTDANLNTREFTYDAQGNLETFTDENRNVTRYDYDAYGNRTRVTRADDSVVDAAYDDLGLVTSISLTRTTPAGPRRVTTTYGYDRNGRTTSVKGPDGLDMAFEYDEFGSVAAVVNSLDQRLEIVSDPAGRMRIARLPDGSTVEAEYHADGRLSQVRNRNGVTAEYAYDGAGRPLGVTGDARGQAFSGVEYGYDGAGRLAQVTLPGQLPLSLEYDASDRISRFAISGTGVTARIDVAYDELGRTKRRTDHLGRETAYDYDPVGRLAAITFPDKRTIAYEYDAAGNLVLARNRSGKETAYGYDALNRLVSVRDALGNETTYDYDEMGNLVAVTDGNEQTTRYEYDGRGRRTAVILPGGQRAELTYDAAGNLVGMSDFNGDTARYAYDDLNRLVLATLPGPTTVEYDYRADGRLRSVVEARGETTYAYNDLGRLVRRTEPGGESIDYAYDDEGHLERITTASGVVSYTYTEFGQLETVTDPRGGVTRQRYDGYGRLVETDRANGLTERYTYDELDRVTGLEVMDDAGTAVMGYDYTYDHFGNVSAVKELGGRVVAYAYDDLNRLTEETITEADGTTRTLGYQYDGNWNRVKKTDSAGGATTYGYDANDRLTVERTPSGDVVYSYDEGGRLTEKRGLGRVESYEWDFRGRLVGATVSEGGGAVEVSYSYDHEGNRTARVIDGAEVRFLVDTNRRLPQVIREHMSSGHGTAAYVYGDALLQRVGGAEDRFYLRDAHSGVRRLADRDGSLGQAFDYDAFGVRPGPAAAGPAYRYQGEQLDPAIDKYYLRARYYDPATGRFLSRDPLEGVLHGPVTRNPYLYAYSNPVLFGDPTGLSGDITLGSVIQANRIRIGIMAVGLVLSVVQQGYANLVADSARVLYKGDFLTAGVIHPTRAAGKLARPPGFSGGIVKYANLDDLIPSRLAAFGFETQLAVARLESQCYPINREPLQYGQQDWVVLWGLTGLGAGSAINFSRSDIEMGAPASFGVNSWYTFDGGAGMFNVALETSAIQWPLEALFDYQSPFFRQFADWSATGVWAGFASGTTSSTAGFDAGVDFVLGLSFGLRWGELDLQCVPEER